nr:hypothetical protein [Tanacetum cinerariifolium]
MIRLCLPQRKSTHLTPPAPVLTVDKADELILQDTLQVSLAKHKSRQEQEARENVAQVKNHLASEEIEKMVEGQEHVVNDSSIPRNDEHNNLNTRLEPRSDKESLKVGITDVIVHMNVYDEEEEEDEITDEVYKLKRREKGKNVEESRITPFSTPIRSPRIHTDLGRYGYLFEHLRGKFMPRKSFVTLAGHLHEAMADSLPTMVDKHIKEQVEKQVLEQVRNQVPVYVAEGLILERQKTKEEMEKMIAKAILQERGNIQNSAKWHKTSEYKVYISGESSSGQDNKQEQGPSTSDIMEDVSLNVDKAKLKKIADEMLRQRCTLRDEYQYHIDQMENFLKSDIVWESHKEILVSP